jgi:peptidyl-prolyl cis-trans isomerase D
MMRQMRENTKWIMLVTALAFVALMVFQWGMDITGRSAGGIGQIGSVNGDPVMYDDYIATYRNLYEQVQQGQAQAVTSDQNRQIEEEAWNQVVTRMLIEQELDRRGIEVTDQEIREAALIAPPPAFMQAPEFLTNGSFDIQKYQSFIRSTQVDDQTLLYLESYYRDVIPRGKLLRQLTSGVYAADDELWQDWRDRNEKVVVRFVALEPALRVPDSLATVTDAEIRDYYDDRREDFETPAQASVRIVTLSKAPTSADSAAALDSARALRQQIQGGTTFADVAARASADSASAANGGSIGTVARNALTPALAEAAFSIPLRQVSEPIQTPLGLHLLQVERRTADSVTASQILIPIARTDDSMDQMFSLADSLEKVSEQQSLDAAAQALGLEVRDVVVNAAFPFVQGAGQVGEGADWALEEATAGEVSPLFESPEAYYLMELVQANPAGTMSLDDARPTIERILQVEKKTARAMDEGRALVERVRSGASLESVAAERGLEVRTQGPFTRAEFVPTLGARNAAIGAAFGLPIGQVSEPVSAASNVFVLEVLSREAADSTAWTQQKDVQRQQLIAVAQQRRMDEWLQGIRETADIVDRRREVLQPAQDQQPLTGTGPFGR